MVSNNVAERPPELGTQGEHSPIALDRRKYRRVNLICRIRLCRHQAPDCIESQTANISSSGFYCYVDRPFLERERLKCEIYLPSYGIESRQLCLTCDARVVRVEPSTIRFGIACELERCSIG